MFDDLEPGTVVEIVWKKGQSPERYTLGKKGTNPKIGDYYELDRPGYGIYVCQLEGKCARIASSPESDYIKDLEARLRIWEPKNDVLKSVSLCEVAPPSPYTKENV